MFPRRRKGAVYIAVLGVFGLVLASFIFAGQAKAGGNFIPLNNELATKQTAAELRAALLFADDQITGLKKVSVGSKFSVYLRSNTINVVCTGTVCLTKPYSVTLPHSVPPHQVLENSVTEKNVICIVKKTIGNEIKTTICEVDDESCCSLA